MNQDISLVSDQDLLEELMGRYEHAAIGLERKHKTDNQLGVYKIRWKGSGFMARGLAMAVIADINNYCDDHAEKPDEDD